MSDFNDFWVIRKRSKGAKIVKIQYVLTIKKYQKLNLFFGTYVPPELYSQIWDPPKSCFLNLKIHEVLDSYLLCDFHIIRIVQKSLNSDRYDITVILIVKKLCVKKLSNFTEWYLIVRFLLFQTILVPYYSPWKELSNDTKIIKIRYV